MISTSRFATCESSCASTPSTSRGSSRCQRPVVTATAAFFGFRPVANAFGTSLSITATLGFGRSAIAASRSTIACSSGASCSVTIFAPDAFSASLSEVKYWKNARAPRIRIIGDDPDVEVRDQHHAEDDVEQPEQSARGEHAESQTRSRP